jgi:hypothetical protein
MNAHILLTNQRNDRVVIDRKHATSETLCGRAATADSVAFAVASKPVASGVVCADCSRSYQHSDFARVRARS